ncbi:hypothetical protein KUF71_014402 [Frankliniella fusca]|uniref:Uncharacterized protein n=1 Tax=Frankliniella fusca TaxID=407009 RepID=A0AAE1HRT2_9NEOP|nr:hypothetical protein KUF71_014402 [Frankliniella fusca]
MVARSLTGTEPVYYVVDASLGMRTLRSAHSLSGQPGNGTLDVVHECQNADGVSTAEMEELSVFAMYLCQRPVQIRLLGFICIEYSLLIKFQSPQP